MVRYVIKRIGLIFFTLFVILSLSFFAIKLIPTHPSLDPTVDPEYYRLMNEKYGFDLPIPVQYLKWLKNILFHWDWGISLYMRPKMEAFSVLFERMPTSMQLNIFSLIISIPFGFLFGIIAALRKNKLTDHVIMLFVIFFISVPSFVIISLLILGPAYYLGWFPIQYPAADVEFMLKIQGMVIPVLALSFGPIATLTRYTRAELTEVLTSDFILLARTKGLTNRQTVIRHALRNSMVPLVPIVISNFVGILFGSLVIERVYGIPGIGGVLVESIGLYDYNVTMAALAFYTIINLFTILIIDLAYGIVDPRIRMGARK